MDFVAILSIFVLACFVGYYVVWSVTPALHTPLMAVTNAISSVIVVGALIAGAALPTAPPPVVATEVSAPLAVDRATSPAGEAVVAATVAVPPAPADLRGAGLAKWFGLLAVALASVNIFGGFAVTERMLAMYRKKAK